MYVLNTMQTLTWCQAVPNIDAPWMKYIDGLLPNFIEIHIATKDACPWNSICLMSMLWKDIINDLNEQIYQQ